MINNWLRIIHDTLYPRVCLLCGAPGQGGLDLCRDCYEVLPFNRSCCRICGIELPSDRVHVPCGDCIVKAPYFDSTVALFRYQEPLRYLIRSLKFHSNFASGRLLGELLVEALKAQDIDRPDLLLPVPLHLKRLRQRGFNQALELARPLSRAFSIPIGAECCVRIRDTRPQFELHSSERQRNIKQAFAIQGPVAEKRIAIVDDVVTTGATVNEIARVLRWHGAQSVTVWCVARAM